MLFEPCRDHRITSPQLRKLVDASLRPVASCTGGTQTSLAGFVVLEKLNLAKPFLGFFQSSIWPTQVSPPAGEDLITISHLDDHGAPPPDPCPGWKQVKHERTAVI
jgi:hypothetical protein